MSVWSTILLLTLAVPCLAMGAYAMLGSFRGLRRTSHMEFEFEDLMLSSEASYEKLMMTRRLLQRPDDNA